MARTVVAPALMPRRPGDRVKTDRRGLDALLWTGPRGVVFGESLHTMDEPAARIQRLEPAIADAAPTSPRAPVIRILQALRGVTRVTVATEEEPPETAADCFVASPSREAKSGRFDRCSGPWWCECHRLP